VLVFRQESGLRWLISSEVKNDGAIFKRSGTAPFHSDEEDENSSTNLERRFSFILKVDTIG
jgi:hypothetical protein